MAQRSKDRGDEGPGLFGPDTFGASAAPLKQAPPAAQKPQTASSAPTEAPALFAEVALNRPMRRQYTYSVLARHAGRVAPGVRVAVPLGPRREVGVVVAVATASDVPAARLKAVLEVLDDGPIVGAELLELTAWIAREYACAWGEALAAALPAALKRERARRTVARNSVATLAPGSCGHRAGT